MQKFSPIFTTDFFESATGTLTVAAAVILVLAAFGLNLSKRRQFSIKALTYSALCVTLAMLLSYVKLFSLPQGGSVTACSMLFISLVGYWLGPAAGILAGVTYGLLDLAVSPYVLHPVQLLLDYPLAFGALGLSGFFCERRNGLYIGYAVGAAGRFFMSFLSGFVFFGSFAPDGMNPVWYSFLYTASYIVPEMLITFAVLSIQPFSSAINREKANLGGRGLLSGERQ